jgi:hypothetical protein
MSKTNLIACLSAGALAVSLVACSSQGDTRAAASPIGSYGSGDIVFRINADGTTVGTDRSGNDWGKGTYVVQGDLITFTEQWYAEAMGLGACLGVPGQYRWSYEAPQMKFEPVSDTCERRAQAIRSTSWTRLD